MAYMVSGTVRRHVGFENVGRNMGGLLIAKIIMAVSPACLRWKYAMPSYLNLRFEANTPVLDRYLRLFLYSSPTKELI